MIVTRCYDVDVIRSIMSHPDIYDRIAEDGTPERQDFIPDMISFAYLAGVVNAEPIGVFVLHPVNGVTWECHVQVLPEYRKDYAHEFGEKCVEYCWELGVSKLVAQIPFLYPNVKDFALRQGFELEGINRKSYLKNGQLYDQWYLGRVR